MAERAGPVVHGMMRAGGTYRMTLPTYYRMVEECTRPLTDTGSPVYRTGLRLEQCDTRVVPCPFAAAFRQHGDAVRFAREYIPSLWSWSESTFVAVLAPDRRLEERQGILERYYGAYETLVCKSPRATERTTSTST